MVSMVTMTLAILTSNICNDFARDHFNFKPAMLEYMSALKSSATHRWVYTKPAGDCSQSIKKLMANPEYIQEQHTIPCFKERETNKNNSI